MTFVLYVAFACLVASVYARKIHIVGGGIGGLTAAHELSLLAPKDTEIHIYEKADVLGGKARSIQVPNTGVDGRENLWGEVCIETQKSP